MATMIQTVENAEKPSDSLSPSPPLELTDVPYGHHERQVLDFWQAVSEEPTPVVLFIHGGGWVKGDNKKMQEDRLRKYLDAGISVVSINYRYTWQAQKAGVEPPVKWPMEDAVRALQFVRSKAEEWNIDKVRIAVSGGSAGACSGLWIALHDDLADPSSPDPVARESSRVTAAAVYSAQTSLDPLHLKEWTPNSKYGGHAFGFMDPDRLETRDTLFDEFLSHREKWLPWIKKYSPIEHVSADDPPVYLKYRGVPSIGTLQEDPTHTPNFGVKLKERMDEIGVECHLVHDGTSDMKYPTPEDFLLHILLKDRE